MKNISFDNVPSNSLIELFKDGRHASHILELWIVNNFENISNIILKTMISLMMMVILWKEKTLQKMVQSLCPVECWGAVENILKRKHIR